MSRLLQQMLFGITPLDAQSYLAAVGILAGTALIACYLPARRAARIDPVVALRRG